jgi:hypothetical protein
MANIQIESRHSDFGPDAGGYSVLRINGVWVGRIESKEAREELKKLVEELEQWKTWGVVEIAVRNPNVAEYMKHWEERATKAEAEVASLKKYIDMRTYE